MMTRAIRFSRVGGPEVLEWIEVQLRGPGPGEVLMRNEAIGANFIDTYQRSGLYPMPLPSGLGIEAAGRVEAVGAGVADFAPGDRVACGTGVIGAYAERHLVAAGNLVHLPDAIAAEVAAALLVKGLTARMLLKGVHKVAAGETILLHAAAGGVGLLTVQLAKSLGATVIGVVGSERKAELARAHGCDHVILGRTENVAARVREITNGEGVPVVYDSVGKDTFEASLNCLAPLGLFVSFGNASGPPPPVPLFELMRRGSLFMTRPTISSYLRTTASLREAAAELFDRVASGVLRVTIHQRFPLERAADAHRALEARATEGATILVP